MIIPRKNHDSKDVGGPFCIPPGLYEYDRVKIVCGRSVLTVAPSAKSKKKKDSPSSAYLRFLTLGLQIR